MNDLNINDVVHVERTPGSYKRIMPFSIVIHCAEFDLSISEMEIIKSAIVNAAHDIRRKRGESSPEPFYWSDSK